MKKEIQKAKKWNHQKHVFLKPLEPGGPERGKTSEMIIEKRMQNMVRFENKNMIFVANIHFEKNKKNEELEN